MKKGFQIVIVALAVVLSIVSSAFAQTASCLSLGTDLFPGNKNESVRFLQVFLNQRGYLPAMPNGIYGPATTAAVKTFQRDNKILQTGNVGPATRAAIAAKGCASLPNQTASAANAVSVPVKESVTIGGPREGDEWTTGQTYLISWSGEIPYMYDIVLDKSDGSSGGFIAHNQTTKSSYSSYSWRAGAVFSSLGEQTAATGTYRVRIQPVSGSTKNDPVSGWFTLKGVPLVVTTVSPPTVPADNRTSLVLVGSGFDSTSLIRADHEFGPIFNTKYVSEDGTVMVVTIPTNVADGRHYLYVNNQTSSSRNMGTIVVTK